MDERRSFLAFARLTWQYSPATILPFQPKLLACVPFPSYASLERPAALGNGQLARRFFDFGLFLGAVGRFLGLCNGGLQREAHSLGFGIDIEHLTLDFFA